MSCKPNGEHQPRIIIGRHRDDCPRDDCTGCQPCTQPHCRVCGIAHHAGACPECVGEARENLREIGRMCGDLPVEVEHRGVNGEAMVLLGPNADPEARGHLEASVACGRVPAEYLEHADHELHPLFILGTWDMLWRDALEHDDPRDQLTVATAIAYLNQQLTYMAGYPWAPFEDFARALRQCRTHLERVLRDGEQIEKGAPCLTCRTPVTRTTMADGETGYRCERCRRDMTQNEYRLAVKAAYVAHADRLNITDLADRIDVPASTIRRWASVRRISRPGKPVTEEPPLLRPCGRDGQKRNVYRVSDAERLRSELREMA